MAAIILPSLTPWTIRSSDEIKMVHALSAHPQRSSTNEHGNPTLSDEQSLNLLSL
ncbi:hypothetical protein N8501_01540 [Synechococcus sp. AH-601-N10]|nr:hypothetical protein [Synechococcus sp. AH-601-N10]